MKTLYLDDHSERCLKYDRTINWLNHHDVCKRNPKRFLFFLNGKYHMLIYHDCIYAHESHIDTKVWMLNTILSLSKIKDKYEVLKSVTYDELRQFRLKNKNIKRYHTEVNYCYSNFSKEYYIVTERKYIDVIDKDAEYLNAYNEAKEYLIEHEMESFIKELDELKWMNRIIRDDEAEVFKTIEHIADLLNTYSKQKSKQDGNKQKSKLKRTSKALV